MTSRTLTGIYSSGYAMHLPVTTVTVASSGVVLGGGVKGETSTAITILNEGEIKATLAASSGVYLGEGGLVTNGATGDTTSLLQGLMSGVDVFKASGTVINFGSVVGAATNGPITYAYVGVYLGAGGSVTNGDDADTSALISGTVRGVGVSAKAGLVSNFGTIVDTDNSTKSTYLYDAVYLGAGGTITNGDQTDTKALISGVVAGVGVRNEAGTVNNFGTILGGTGAGFGRVGVYLAVGGSVTNGALDDQTAVISGLLSGVVAKGRATIVNYGSVIGESFGIYLADGGLVINGAVNDSTALDFYGVDILRGAGTVTNFGTMSRPDQAIYLGAGGDVINGSSGDTAALIEAGRAIILKAAGAVTNYGTVTGYGYSPVAASVFPKAAGAVTNYRTVTGYGYLPFAAAVNLYDGGTVTNGAASEEGALIRGSGGVAVRGAGGKVTNFGTIDGVGVSFVNYGVVLSDGGAVTNGAVNDQGALVEAYTGVGVTGAAGTVSNYGTIKALGVGRGYGIQLDSGAVVNGATTDETALIESATGGVIVTRGTGTVENLGTILTTGSGLGVGLLRGGVVTNGSSSDAHALIQGYTGLSVYGGSEVTNFGTIAGSSGTAVVFYSASVALYVEAGCAFVGAVDGDGGLLDLASGAGTLTGNLAGGSVTVSGSMAAATFNNFGTVEVGAGARFTIAAPLAIGASQTLIDAGVLRVSGPVVSAGMIEATGVGELIITGGATDSFAGTFAGSGLIDLAGVSASLGTLTITASDVVIGAGALSIAGPVTIASGGRVFLQGSVTNSGTFTLASSGPATDIDINGNTTLTGGGTLSLAGSHPAEDVVYGLGAADVLTNVNNTIAGGGDLQLTLINQAAGIIDASASSSLVLLSSATLANAGLIEATGTGGLCIRSVVNNAGGGVIAAAGGNVFLQSADILGGTLRSMGGKIIFADTGADTLDGTASAVNVQCRVEVNNGENLNLAGTIDNTGQIELGSDGTPTTLTIGAVGTTLTGAGEVYLGNDNAAAEVIGATSATTLDNVANVIAGTGDLGGGKLTLINGAAGIILGEDAVAFIVDTGSSTIVNAGRIENSGQGGTIVRSAVANTGALIAEGGTLTLDGAVTGTGEALIYSGTLDFASSFSQSVTFRGSSGVLELAQSQSYGGTISDFSTTGGTSLDLADIEFVGAAEATFSGTTSGGVLTVSDGIHAAHIHLSGNYTASNWVASSDGHGGTIVVDPTPTNAAVAPFSLAPAHRFIAAMAVLANFGGGAIHNSQASPPRELILATPAR